MFTKQKRKAGLITAIVFGMLYVSLQIGVYAGEIKTYTKDVSLSIGKGDKAITVTQKRWYLENDFVKLGVIDDPGGAVVEFTNKENGVNHVAGDVYKFEKDGKTIRKAGWGWCEYMYDTKSDPMQQWMLYQPFNVKFIDSKNGAKSIKVTGHTAQQKIERLMTLKPDSAELIVKIKLTNISNHKKILWMRWHPRIFPSKDVRGKHSCVLVPAENDEVVKIRTGWAQDNWYSVKHGCWLTVDFKTGDGLFCTFEKDKTHVLSTWTEMKNWPRHGAVVMETMPKQTMAEPGEFIEQTFTYYPFSAKTKPASIPLGMVSNKGEQKQALTFLKRALPLKHLKKFGDYSYANTIQFPWAKQRKDQFALRDWGWADCAIMGYPYQNMPLKIRLTGAMFPEASTLKNWPKWKAGVRYVITVKNQDGLLVYKYDINRHDYRAKADYCSFSDGNGSYDHAIAVPMNGIPDGTYTLKIEALDPITRKVFHTYQRKLEIFGKRFKQASKKLKAELNKKDTDRPFVVALGRIKELKITNNSVTVPIGIEDGSNVKRINFPVRLGVPFPQGKFKVDVPVQLLSPKGKEITAQFRVMNVWPDKSLKWLQIDFQANCPARGFDFYKLEIGDKAHATSSTHNLITEKEDNYIINTGIMRVVVSKNNLNIPGKIYIDKNKDGNFAENELVMRNSQIGDAWWEDGKGTVFKMQFGGKNSGFFKPGASIEENGKLTAIIKLQGWYSDKAHPKQHPAYGEVRLTFYKGKARVDIHHQVTFTGSPWDTRLASYGLKLNPQAEIYKNVIFDVDGKAVTLPVQGTLNQTSFNRLKVSSDGKTVASGEKSDGAVSMNGKGGDFIFLHKNLWQMYPKKLQVDTKTGELVVSYWPKEAGEFSFAPDFEYTLSSSSSPEACGTGMSRTQEMVLDFSGMVKVTEARRVYGEPVVACVPPIWIKETNAVGSLSVYNPAIVPAAEEFIKLYIDFQKRNRKFFHFYGQWNYGTLHNVLNLRDYKWLMVGRYPNIGNEEDIVRAPWLLYMRSGDRKYLKFAILWTRHLMETQSIRWHDLYPHGIGMSRRHHYTAWLGHADYGHTMLDQYLEYYHCTAYRPAWDMAKLTAKAMSYTYAGTWRYLSNPIIGNIRMYLETGDEKYKKVSDRIWKDLCNWNRNNWWGASHGSRMVRWYAPFNKACMKAWKEWTRTGFAFSNIDSFGDLWKITKDPWFCHRARCHFDALRSRNSGLNHGINPIYRGYVPFTMNTQSYMGLCRELTIGKDAIAESIKLFPAAFYGLGKIKNVIIKEDKDKDFTIWVSLRGTRKNKGKITILAPDGTPAITEEKEIFKEKGVAPKNRYGFRFLKITVKKDGKSGIYTIKPFSLEYFGCSEAKTAIVVGNSLRGSGDTLYVNSDNLGAPEMFVLMNGSPGTSLELFTLDGKRLFSNTMVRPECDAVGVEFKQKLPVNTVLRIGDRSGVTFPKVGNIYLFPNKNGVFKLDK